MLGGDAGRIDRLAVLVNHNARPQLEWAFPKLAAGQARVKPGRAKGERSWPMRNGKRGRFGSTSPRRAFRLAAVPKAGAHSRCRPRRVAPIERHKVAGQPSRRLVDWRRVLHDRFLFSAAPSDSVRPPY
jgi:hypothetical protein